jgi:hypothetical protein
VEGTPSAVGVTDNTIVCSGHALVVQNTNTGPDTSCTQTHESSHIADWQGRYGNDLCKDVGDGFLPTGGPGYDAFLKRSECKAYRAGKTCRTALLRNAADADKPAIQAGIDRDNTQITANCA